MHKASSDRRRKPAKLRRGGLARLSWGPPLGIRRRSQWPRRCPSDSVWSTGLEVAGGHAQWPAVREAVREEAHEADAKSTESTALLPAAESSCRGCYGGLTQWQTGSGHGRMSPPSPRGTQFYPQVESGMLASQAGVRARGCNLKWRVATQAVVLLVVGGSRGSRC